MTEELQKAMGDIFDARVPGPWLRTPAGDEFSWLSPSLGPWFAGLQERDAQLRSWINDGAPNSYWMTGFFNPQAFLTAMKQTVARKHKWALDAVDYDVEVKEMAGAQAVRAAAEEGVFVHGLFIEGARWNANFKSRDGKKGSLDELQGKQRVDSLPVIRITVVKASAAESHANSSSVYMCPLYRYARRTDLHIVFSAPLNTLV
eukprot:CAMPEP_0116855762 /NCGR_PEP_ID=MMETSP0418-20121206/19482_1 /TAXON_ID=1158023 /ORGANISM="Astrosyne radiata, Strain 13vi08-1A" /LENGTH=202 /DNA_ID=CAMNT_0004488979 /DNA_START=50 /DNA_END=655 /DNA_ORIENTATION=+